MQLKSKTIQWNCRGLKPNYNEVLLLFTLVRPSVFCLQDIFLKPDDNITFKSYNLYNCVYTDGQKHPVGVLF